ncbi:hypothetical protein BpHYR1_047963 [Brachionus plicatilis]|uniref:Uncharacterized protein n=1 Tax=Brachionus plicatilis TaxID=10195 RepID=A0A3M7T9K0_BRAPC|nr:hypothetical protein BpHYR1_047963 [Brachionus plicatilis]
MVVGKLLRSLSWNFAQMLLVLLSSNQHEHSIIGLNLLLGFIQPVRHMLKAVKSNKAPTELRYGKIGVSPELKTYIKNINKSFIYFFNSNSIVQFKYKLNKNHNFLKTFEVFNFNLTKMTNFCSNLNK